MKASNFKLIKVHGKEICSRRIDATIDIKESSGRLWWKRYYVATWRIHRSFCEGWMFIDEGKQESDMDRGMSMRIDKAARHFEAKYALDLELIPEWIKENPIDAKKILSNG